MTVPTDNVHDCSKRYKWKSIHLTFGVSTSRQTENEEEEEVDIVEIVEEKSTQEVAGQYCARRIMALSLRCILPTMRSTLLAPKMPATLNLQRFKHLKEIETPKPGVGHKQYRRFVLNG